MVNSCSGPLWSIRQLALRVAQLGSMTAADALSAATLWTAVLDRVQ